MAETLHVFRVLHSGGFTRIEAHGYDLDQYGVAFYKLVPAEFPAGSKQKAVTLRLMTDAKVQSIALEQPRGK